MKKRLLVGVSCLTAVVTAYLFLVHAVDSQDEYRVSSTLESAIVDVRLHPNRSNAHLILALHYRDAGELEKSLEEFAAASSLDHAAWTSHMFSAEILDDQGKRAAALPEWRKTYEVAHGGSKDQQDAGRKVVEHGGRF